MVKKNILGTIGTTPMVRINRLCPNPNVKIFAKLEGFNPTGSIKDRIALRMIEAAERDGRLTPGKTIIEPTSGNTGIGLAIVGIVKGYPVEIVMSEAVSIERRKIIRSYGAKVILTPAEEGMKPRARTHPSPRTRRCGISVILSWTARCTTGRTAA